MRSGLEGGERPCSEARPGLLGPRRSTKGIGLGASRLPGPAGSPTHDEHRPGCHSGARQKRGRDACDSSFFFLPVPAGVTRLRCVPPQSPLGSRGISFSGRPDAEWRARHAGPGCAHRRDAHSGRSAKKREGPGLALPDAGPGPCRSLWARAPSLSGGSGWARASPLAPPWFSSPPPVFFGVCLPAVRTREGWVRPCVRARPQCSPAPAERRYGSQRMPGRGAMAGPYGKGSKGKGGSWGGGARQPSGWKDWGQSEPRRGLGLVPFGGTEGRRQGQQAPPLAAVERLASGGLRQTRLGGPPPAGPREAPWRLAELPGSGLRR